MFRLTDPCVFLQLPVIGLKMYIFPILGIIGGALYSCYNYFYVILNGGVGKNGSTVAVSQHTYLHFTQSLLNIADNLCYDAC